MFLRILALLCAVCSFSPSFAEEKILRWAADAESGVPYVFYDPKNPTQLIGFEVDIIKAIAKEIGAKDVFVQNSWEGLIPGLTRREYDVAINGIEITEDRKSQVLFSNPYFATVLQIATLRTNDSIHSFQDLIGKKVGTLSGAVSERTLKAEKGITPVPYDSENNAHEDLLHGRTDAVLFDAPIVKYFSEPNPQLRVLNEDIGILTYGIVMSKERSDLAAEINTALVRLQNSGELRAIVEKWNLWNPRMAELTKDTRPAMFEPTSYQYYMASLNKDRTWAERLTLYKDIFPLLLWGAVQTLQISVLAMAVAILGGLVIALIRVMGPVPFQYLAIAFVEIIRGTPLLLQLFFIFYALPSIGIKLPPLFAAVLGLGLNYAANESENYRAGIASVHKDQTEAALALGMNKWQSLRHIVFPQALRLVIPPMTNDFIALIKDSSLVSVITMVELTKISSQLSSTYYDYVGIGLMAAALYLVMGLPFVRLARSLEKNLQKKKLNRLS